jgi:hypothetical protein
VDVLEHHDDRVVLRGRCEQPRRCLEEAEPGRVRVGHAGGATSSIRSASSGATSSTTPASAPSTTRSRDASSW